MNKKIKSLLFGLIIWLLLNSLTVLIIFGSWDRAKLISETRNEQILNTLFTNLRSHEDFGSAIEADPALVERIRGFAVFSGSLVPVYSWGNIPNTLDEKLLEEISAGLGQGRLSIPVRVRNSMLFILRAENLQVASPQPNRSRGRQMHHNFAETEHRGGPPMRVIERQGFPFFNTLARGRYYYFEIYHPEYWRAVNSGILLLPLSFVFFLGLVLVVRRMYLKNSEYRDHIEMQKRFVVLGTAAGTLAHEIKNPLSSILLQTRILEKLYSGGTEELRIINDEVNRLSYLSQRISDYIIDRKGNPSEINAYELIYETGMKLLGRNILNNGSQKEIKIFADPERLRSVFENLLRNALESGGQEENIEVIIKKIGNEAYVNILDCGHGIDENDIKYVFDPFFTRKSKGTGIGLTICKNFIEAAGGSITIKNRNDNISGVDAAIIFPEYNDNGDL